MKKIALALTLAAASAFGGAFHTEADKAFAEAKKKKLPVLVSFYGIWCPPCNQLEETVFESRPFLEKAKSFVLLKLDADAEASWKWKDKYKVGGYPTVVFTSSTGGEMYRVVGSRSVDEFLRVMELVRQAGNRDLAKSCGGKSTDDLWRCASVCQERKDKKCADKAFGSLAKSLKAADPRLLEAKGYFADTAATADLKIQAYEKLLQEHADSPKAAYWAYSYMGMFEPGKTEPKKALVEKVLASMDAMAEHPDREFFGISKTDLLQIQGTLLGRLGREEEAKKVWAAAAAAFAALAKSLPEGSPARGFTIERISCLEEAGSLDEALALAADYRKRFPDDFTFHYQAAGLLNRAKRYGEALPIARRAFEVSYGDNRIRAATLLVKLLATVPDRPEAVKVYRSVREAIKPDTKLEIRTHRYLEALDKAFLAMNT